MTGIELSNHVRKRGQVRLGLDPLKASMVLEALLISASEFSFEEAAGMFTLTEHEPGDRFFVAPYAHGAMHENVCFIVREATAVTLLTENMYASPYTRSSRRGQPQGSRNPRVRLTRILPDGTKGPLSPL